MAVVTAVFVLGFHVGTCFNMLMFWLALGFVDSEI